MEKEGLITRVVIPTKPIQIEYSLTKKGEMLEPVLKILANFL
jgi:DNA-binding HxlR family transcriptional regulator